jgi:hypothetical protein
MHLQPIANTTTSVFRKRTTQVVVALITIFLTIGCTPIQPLPSAPPATGLGDAITVLGWEGFTAMGDGDATRCKQLQLTIDNQALVGDCAALGEPLPLSTTHSHEWTYLQANLAPFTWTTATDQLDFRGAGNLDGEAWQRALLAWTHLVYGELASGRVSAAVATALSWNLGEAPTQPGLCNHLTVTVYGYAYADHIPCAGGPVQNRDGAWLPDQEMAQFDRWLYGRQPLYEGDNYLAGLGDEPLNEAELAELTAWADEVYLLLRAGKPGLGESVLPAGCTEPFEQIRTTSAAEIERVISEYEPPAPGEPMTLNWDSATLDAIVTQLVAAGEHYLNECAGGPPVTPILEQLAELSQVVPEMTVTIPGSGDFLPLEMQLTPTIPASALLQEIDGDGQAEVILQTQVGYFDAEEALFGLRGGVTIVFTPASGRWEGHVIWPVPHFVPRADDYLEYAPFFAEEVGAEVGWSAVQALIADPGPTVELLNLDDAAGNRYLAVSHIRRTPLDDIRELNVLRWRAEGPELALRIVLYNWCVSVDWEIRSDGTIFVPALPEPFPHCQGEYAARTYSLEEGRFVEVVNQ